MAPLILVVDANDATAGGDANEDETVIIIFEFVLPGCNSISQAQR